MVDGTTLSITRVSICDVMYVEKGMHHFPLNLGEKGT